MFQSISRRKLLTSALRLSLATQLRHSAAYASTSVTAGAIRWDAWSATGTIVEKDVGDSLSSPEFRGRAPWYARLNSRSALEIDGEQQSLMDLEIGFARSARLNYWAYCWYGAADPMQKAWRLHQTSVFANDVNWCMILQSSRLGTEASFVKLISSYVDYFGRKNYQKIAGQRPLLYLFIDNLKSFFDVWGEMGVKFGNALSELRSSCLAIGLGAPYVVIMEADPAIGARIVSAAKADAISNYMARVPPHPIPTAFSALDQSVKAYWPQLGATGVPIVPICMTGWDTRPLRMRPLAWYRTTDYDLNHYIKSGSPNEIAEHVQAAIRFVDENPTTCPTRTIIIYSWNECAEGGSALVPSYTASKPNDTILNAVGAVLRRH
jgi:hypothetical protein